MKIRMHQKHEFSSNFDDILTILERHFGASWGGHFTEQVTFLELRKGFKNETKIEIPREELRTALNTILSRLGTLTGPQKYCKTQGI